MNLYTGDDPDSGVRRGGVCRCGRVGSGGWEEYTSGSRERHHRYQESLTKFKSWLNPACGYIINQ